MSPSSHVSTPWSMENRAKTFLLASEGVEGKELGRIEQACFPCVERNEHAEVVDDSRRFNGQMGSGLTGANVTVGNKHGFLRIPILPFSLVYSILHGWFAIRANGLKKRIIYF